MSDQRIAPLEEMKLQYVRHVLDRCEGNKRRAAALLGIGRRTLYEYLKKIEPQATPESEPPASERAIGRDR